jgi:single stranded DNA-binding protein
MVRREDGQENETAQFHQVVCWDKLADVVGKYVKKGRQLYVEGQLEYRIFEGEDGSKRGTTEIVASDVQFLSVKPSEKEVETAAQLWGDSLAKTIASLRRTINRRRRAGKYREQRNAVWSLCAIITTSSAT